MMNEKTICEVFAKNLCALLKDRKISQKEFAQRLEVTKDQVSRWATAKNAPTWGTIATICDEFNIHVHSLFKDEAADDLALLQRLRRLELESQPTKKRLRVN